MYLAKISLTRIGVYVDIRNAGDGSVCCKVEHLVAEWISDKEEWTFVKINENLIQLSGRGTEGSERIQRD